MNGYVIADANKTMWVCKNKDSSYSLTTDSNKALIFESKSAANATFQFNLPKLIKDKGVAVKAVTLQIAGVSAPKAAKEPVTNVAPQASNEADTSKYIISVLSDAVAKLNCRHVSLVEEESKYDRQRTDVEHYIELNAGKLNAYEGYQAYKMLQDVLLKRRKVKDELQIIQVVRDKMAFPDDIANIDSKVKELESRHYEPREFKHLFEGGKK